MRRGLLVITAVASWGCGIPDDDLLPGIGAPCAVNEGLCSLELTCRPDEPGGNTGLCAPVASYGTCDEPTHPPGRFGTVKDGNVAIDQQEDVPKMDNVRLVTGQLTLFNTSISDLPLGDLCPLRALQRVGDTLTIGDTGLENVDGLQSLTSVKNGIAIFGNGELTSLAGLGSLVDLKACDVGEEELELFIVNNNRLPASEVTSFIDALEDRLARDVAVTRCGNGPITDRDGLCPDASELLNRLNNGDGFCE